MGLDFFYNPNPQKGFQILSPNKKSEDFLDFLDPSVQSFQPLDFGLAKLAVAQLSPFCMGRRIGLACMATSAPDVPPPWQPVPFPPCKEGALWAGALNPHSLPNASQTGHLSPACHKQNLGIWNRGGAEGGSERAS